MAQVSIKDKFFSSPELKIFSFEMRKSDGWDAAKCVGYLTLFWHYTQANETHRCTFDALLMHVGCCYDTSNAENRVVDALLTAGLVKRHSDDDTYEIIGNEKNIDGILATKRKNKKAILSRWEGQKDTTGIPQVYPTNTTGIPHEYHRYTPRIPRVSPSSSSSTSTSSSELTNVYDPNEKYKKRNDSDPKKSNARSVCAREAAGEIIKDDLTFLEEKLLPTEKKSRPKKKIDITKFSEAEIAAARRWAKITESETPWLADKIDYGEYAEAIAKIKRHIKIGDDAMDYLIGFIERDEFWRRNAISPKSVFKKNTAGVYKIDNIVIAMKSTDTRFKQAAVLAQLQAEGYE